MKSFDSVPIKRLVSPQGNRLNIDFQGKRGFPDLRTWCASKNKVVNDNFLDKTRVSFNDVKDLFQSVLNANETKSLQSRKYHDNSKSSEQASQNSLLTSNTAKLSTLEECILVDEDENFAVPDLLIADSLMKSEYHYRCASMAYGFDCPNCNERVQKPRLCGDRWECPICARIYAKSAGRRLYCQLYAFNAVHYRELVFTWEKDWVEQKFSGLGFSQIEKRLAKGLANFIKKFFGSGLGFVIAIHCWKTGDPLGELHWHAHVLMPCIRFDKKKKCWVRLSPYIHLEQLDELRRAWGVYNNSGWLWVWHEYWDKEYTAKFRHKCSYILRRPVLDVNDYCLKNNVQEFTADEWFAWQRLLSLRSRKSRVHRYGFLAHGVVSRYLTNRLGLVVSSQAKLEGGEILGHELKELRKFAVNKIKKHLQRLIRVEGKIYCPHRHCRYDLTDVWKEKKASGGLRYEATEIELVIHRKLVWRRYREVAV